MLAAWIPFAIHGAHLRVAARRENGKGLSQEVDVTVAVSPEGPVGQLGEENDIPIRRSLNGRFDRREVTAPVGPYEIGSRADRWQEQGHHHREGDRDASHAIPVVHRGTPERLSVIPVCTENSSVS